MNKFSRELMRGYWMGMALAGMTIAGCATAFPWKYYATNMPDSCYDSGVLYGTSGSDGWPDLSLDECKPDPDPSPGASPSVLPVKLKCITMKDGDFYSLQADDLKCHKDLQNCQDGPVPQPSQ